MPERFSTADISVSIFNPFPGLRAFEPGESYLYFGRERQTDELLRRLRGTHFLSVVGTSGSGKSSLVRAGLVPALHSGFMTRAGSSWRVAILRPGGDPIGHLARALADPGVLGQNGGAAGDDGRSILETTLRGSSLGLAECVEVARIPERDNVLIVIDQFEELFRFKRGARSAADRDQAVAFVKLLLAAAGSRRLYVVITMRSDFIGDCMEFPKLPEAINDGQYLVPRMTRSELRMAITGPVGVRAAKISPRLVARLLNEVGDDPDHLPVLQHALMRMWVLWEASNREGALDLGHYREIGTMKEALSRHAEKAYGELAPGRQQRIAERLFKALTETERGGRGVRRPARLGEICDIAEASVAEVAEVIRGFRQPGRSFLMPPFSVVLNADSVLDLSHESLMRNWRRLVRWTAEEAAAGHMYRRLARAAHRHDKGEAALWRSPELDLGLRWREENRPTAAWARRYDPGFEEATAFLDASARDRDRRRDQRHLARRKKTRLKASFAAVLAILTLLVLVFWDVTVKAQYLQAILVALTEDDPLIKAQVLVEVPPTPRQRIARLLGSAGETSDDLLLETVRRVALEAIPSAVFRAPAAPGGVPPALTCAALSPDGALAVIGAADGNAWIWSSDGGGDPIRLQADRSEGVTKAHLNKVTSAAFNPRGESVVTASADGTVRVWSPDGEQLADLDGHRGAVVSAAFSPAGDLIVTASRDETARIWPSDGQGLPVVLRHRWDVVSASFDASGRRVATASERGPARIWNLDGRELRRFRGHQDEQLTGAWLTPDGHRLLVATKPSGILVYSEDGEHLASIRHEQSVTGVSFSPDGKWALTAAEDARLWKLDDGTQRAVFRHGARITSASLLAGGDRVLTASLDGTARIWSLDGEEQRELRGHLGAVDAMALTGDAASDPIGITASEDGTARVWPLATGEPRLLGRHRERVTALAFQPLPRGAGTGSPVGAISTSKDGTVRIWRLEGQDAAPEEMAELETGAAVEGASYHPTAAEIVTAGGDAVARIWRPDPPNGWIQAGVLEGHDDALTSARYGPGEGSPGGGDRIVTASRDGTARIWRRDPSGLWQEAGVLQGHDGWVMSAAFDPGGERLLTASFDSTAVVWRRDARGTWAEADRLHVPREALRSASFSPAGDRILTSSVGSVWLWSPDGEGGWTAPEATKLKGHRDHIYGAAFSPTGDRVVTASADGKVRVWSTETGGLLYLLEVGEPVRSARFSPGASHLLTGSAGGAVQLWRVSQYLLEDYIESSNNSCLTIEQRRRFLNERQGTARSRFAACEQRHGRTPPADVPTRF